MANTFDNTKPILRELDLEGYPVRVRFDAEGVHFVRKGARGKSQVWLDVSWTDIAEIGAEKAGVDFYSHLGFED